MSPLLLPLIFLGSTMASFGAELAETNLVAADSVTLLRRDSDLLATGIKMFGAFAIVLAVFGGFVLAVKKWGHLANSSSVNRDLKVLEYRVLAHKTYVYVMQHGPERFIISVNANGTTLLTPSGIPSPEEQISFQDHELQFAEPKANS